MSKTFFTRLVVKIERISIMFHVNTFLSVDYVKDGLLRSISGSRIDYVEHGWIDIQCALPYLTMQVA